MQAKTKVKIDFYPNNFTAKKEFFRAKIVDIGISRFKKYNVSGSYFYKEGGVEIKIGGFSFGLDKSEVDVYFKRFNSDKADFIDKLEQTLYYMLLEKMASDITAMGFAVAVSDLEIVN